MADFISLHQLNTRIKEELADSFPQTMWIVAEISELRTHNSGHCYLELIEKDLQTSAIIAKARATIWASTYRMVKPYFETSTGQSLTSGLKILIRVSIEFQEAFGLSLNVRDINPTFTLGDIAKQRLEVIKQLKEEGVFGMNKELDLATVPQRLAIISSPSAAGYEDFINQLENSCSYKIYHKLYPAIMQGDKAEASIINALDNIYKHEHFFDAVILIRGGGSTTDLMCFDGYDLALNIAQFPLPVITGIGHERDESVADMVAHTKLKTPTAVAEFIIETISAFHSYVDDLQDQFLDTCRHIITHNKHRLELAAQKFQPLVKQRLLQKRRQPDEATKRLSFVMKSYFDLQHRLLSHSKESLLYLVNKQIKTNRQELKFINSKLKLDTLAFLKTKRQTMSLLERTNELTNPYHILKKGYSITSTNSKIVKNISELNTGDVLKTQLASGIITSRIEHIEPNK